MQAELDASKAELETTRGLLEDQQKKYAHLMRMWALNGNTSPVEMLVKLEGEHDALKATHSALKAERDILEEEKDHYLSKYMDTLNAVLGLICARMEPAAGLAPVRQTGRQSVPVADRVEEVGDGVLEGQVTTAGEGTASMDTKVLGGKRTFEETR